jgi:transcriptional regulator with XRE-family HTH domain
MKKVHELFLAALRFSMRNAKHGDKTGIAYAAGLNISTFLNIESGRRGASEDKRRAIAESLGYEYETFLLLGEKLLSGAFIREPDELIIKSKGQAEAISARTAHLIEKIILIAAADENRLSYVEVLTNSIYHDLKALSRVGKKNCGRIDAGAAE